MQRPDWAASLMLAASVPMKVAQETLGYSSIGLTTDTYTSMYPQVAIEAAEAAATIGHAAPWPIRL